MKIWVFSDHRVWIFTRGNYRFMGFGLKFPLILNNTPIGQ